MQIPGRALPHTGTFPSLKAKQHLALSSPAENKPTSSVGLNKATLVKGWRAPASWLNSREGAVFSAIALDWTRLDKKMSV